MKETVMYAKYNQAGNRAVFSILSEMSGEDREKDRGSYYGSLSELFRHIMGGTLYFLGVYKSALKNKEAALKALAPLDGLSVPEGKIDDSQWKGLKGTLDLIDAAYVAMAETLDDADMALPVKIDWYRGNPPEVSLFFMLHQLVVHNTHHRGQISQILDSMKIDNDYSGIDLDCI